VTGDLVAVREAAELLGKIETVAVKEAYAFTIEDSQSLFSSIEINKKIYR